MTLPTLSKLKTSPAGQYLATAYLVTFKIPSGFTTDADGNRVPSAVASIQLSCRLKRTSPSAKTDRLFPGTDQHQTIYHGWVNEGTPPVFPSKLRQQRILVGTVTIDGIAGRLECKLTAITQGSTAVGERFDARFTPD
jgi:hypothetical protein